jgi:hypothetical protein
MTPDSSCARGRRSSSRASRSRMKPCPLARTRLGRWAPRTRRSAGLRASHSRRSGGTHCLMARPPRRTASDGAALGRPLPGDRPVRGRRACARPSRSAGGAASRRSEVRPRRRREPRVTDRSGDRGRLHAGGHVRRLRAQLRLHQPQQRLRPARLLAHPGRQDAPAALRRVRRPAHRGAAAALLVPELRSLHRTGPAARVHADLVVAPRVDSIGLTDWKALGHVRELGRRAAREALAADPDLRSRPGI